MAVTSGSTNDDLLQVLRELKQSIDDMNNNNMYHNGGGKNTTGGVNNMFGRTMGMSRSLMADANEGGYVGNVGYNPMFSQEIATLRKEIEENNKAYKSLANSLDEWNEDKAAALTQKKQELNDLKNEYEQNVPSDAAAAGFFDVDEAINRYEELLKKIQQGVSLTQEEFDDYIALKDPIQDIVDKKEEINNLSGERIDLEEKIENAKMEGLRLAIKEQKELQKINKELEYRNKLEENTLTLNERISHFLNAKVVNTDKFSSAFNEITQGLSKVKSGMEKILGDWTKMDQAASDYAKKVGMSGAAYRQFRANIITGASKPEIARYGISVEEQMSAIGDYTEAVGRQNDVTEAQQLQMNAGMRLFNGENAKQFMANLEKYGMNMDTALEKATDLFKMSSNAGVAWSKTSKIFLDNIKLAQKYTFREGLDGLTKMAKRSAEIKMNLSDVAAFVEKTSTLEGSMQAAAGLSVLGGTFALGSNPMSMLYNALNDFEGAEKQIENMIEGLVVYNNKTKQLEMSSFNKMRLRAAAQATGMNYDTLLESAYSKGRENVVAPIVKSLGYAKGSEEYEMLVNRSQLDKNGKPIINVNNQRKELSQITKKDIEDLKRSNFSENENLATITNTLLGWDDQMKGIKEGVRAQKAYLVESSGLGESAKSMLDVVQEHTEQLGTIISIINTIQTLVGLGMMVNGGLNAARSFGGARPPGLNYAPQTPKPGQFLANASKGQVKGFGRSVYEQTYATTAGSMRERMRAASRATMQALKHEGYTGNAAAVARSAQRGHFASSIGGRVGTVGMIGGVLGGSLLSSSGEQALAKGSTRSVDVRKKTAGGALTWGSMGLGMGSMFGPWGMAIGGIGGLIGGAVSSHASAEGQRLRNVIAADYGVHLNGDYSNRELQVIVQGEDAIRRDAQLKDKLLLNEGIDESKLGIFKKMKDGGSVKPRRYAEGGTVLKPDTQSDKPQNLTEKFKSITSISPRSYTEGGIVLIPEIQEDNVDNLTEKFKKPTSISPRKHGVIKRDKDYQSYVGDITNRYSTIRLINPRYYNNGGLVDIVNEFETGVDRNKLNIKQPSKYKDGGSFVQVENQHISDNISSSKSKQLINPRKFTEGGVLNGIGGYESDENLAWLSNNEYVMPAKQAIKPSNRKILDSMRKGDELVPTFKDGGTIKGPSDNPMDVMKVSGSQKVESIKESVLGGKLEFSPINITGTIKLDLPNGSREIDSRDLLNNSVFLSKLTDVIARNIQIKTEMGYNKDKFYKKF